MSNRIIGREKEIKLLQEMYRSNASEFIAVYGRRRVGKTFMIRETLGDKFIFDVAGLSRAGIKEQLVNFNLSLNRNNQEIQFPVAKNWIDAFEQLFTLVEKSSQKRKVLFFDEIPWMDTLRSGFLTALEHFWNGRVSARKDVVLIVCGSASSWIINKLINNHKGLHNRLTRIIQLRPFTLHECELYFHSRKINLNRYQIAECYMVMGGIPYYMNHIVKGMSASQNINRIFFNADAPLKNEFRNLYASLFNNSADYLRVVAALSKKMKGLSRNEIAETSGMGSGGGLTVILQSLEYCGFIRSYPSFDRKKRNVLYQLIDPFTLFYYKFIEKNEYNDEQFWTNSLNTPLRNSWAGYAFEILAILHIKEIKEALGIAGIQSSVSTWRSEKMNPGAQIDLIINRKDGIINLIEIKFSNMKYTITKSFEENLKNKIAAFQAETRTRKTVHLLMLSTFGKTQNKYSDILQNELLLNDLFK
ncbi:MAG: ATP-binding protein [Tannerella sp.]|jgi:AAA+ ATPase superfamily predicted ATPase|nr:ATP-binding protein [Tannerella sp.]